MYGFLFIIFSFALLICYCCCFALFSLSLSVYRVKRCLTMRARKHTHFEPFRTQLSVPLAYIDAKDINTHTQTIEGKNVIFGYKVWHNNILIVNVNWIWIYFNSKIYDIIPFLNSFIKNKRQKERYLLFFSSTATCQESVRAQCYACFTKKARKSIDFVLQMVEIVLKKLFFSHYKC